MLRKAAFVLLIFLLFFSAVVLLQSCFRARIERYARSGKGAQKWFFRDARAALFYNSIANAFSKSRRASYGDYVNLLCATVALTFDDYDRFFCYLQKVKHMDREKKFWLALYHMAACHDPKAAEPYLLPPREPSRYYGSRKERYLYSNILVPCERSRDQILQGVYLLETGKCDEGWALLEEAYPDVRFDACKKLLQQYVEKYAQRDETGEIIIPPRAPKAFEFSETVQAVREALIREYPLTENMGCSFDCFRLDKWRYVVFWEEAIPNHPDALCLMFEKLRYETQTKKFPPRKLLIVIGETTDTFPKAILDLCSPDDSHWVGVRFDCFASLYLIDRENHKIYKNGFVPFPEINPKRQFEKIDEIVQKTLFG